MININNAVEISSRGYDNTLNNAQRVLVDAYIQCVLEEEHGHSFQKIDKLSNLFEELLNELA